MNLERLEVKICPRPTWQAIDLGFLFVQRWAAPLYAVAVLALLPVLLLLGLLAQWNTTLAAVACWWLKPVLEGPQLLFLSRALFGERPPFRQLPSLCVAAWRQTLVRQLTLERFSICRSYDAPVSLLEKQTGQQRNERLRLLKKQDGSTLMACMAVLYVVEMIVAFAMVSGLSMMVPETVDPWQHIWQQDWLWQMGLMLIYLTAVLLVSPFFVAAGFSTYLNRRTQLEGWDIELAFRRWLVRVPPQSATRGSSVAAVLLLLLMPLLMTAEPVRAQVDGGHTPNRAILDQTSAPLRPADDSPLQFYGDEGEHPIDVDLYQVYRSEDFQQTHTARLWKPMVAFLRWLEDEETEEESDLWQWPQWLQDWLSWLQYSGGVLAGLGVVIEWLLKGGLLLVLLALVVVMVKHRRHWLTMLPKPPVDLPSTVTVDTLAPCIDDPLELANLARQLLKQQRQREALGLLYRGLAQRLARKIGGGYNEALLEHQCLQLCQRLPEAQAQFPKQLIKSWQRLAYAHQTPAQIECEGFVEAWLEWQREPLHVGS